jgi:DNA helicase-2/ATP-dependent DNA helicase PcrA
VLLDLGLKGMDSNFWKAFSGRGATVLADFGAMLSVWREQLNLVSLPLLFDRIVSDIVYQPYIDDSSEEGSDRWENVQELRRLAFEYEERGLPVFLETLALVSDQDTLPEQANAPTLLTLHAAKGLEFGQVFIIGLDEGLLPHSRSLDEPEEMAEERRLFYVGLTRARNRLFLVRADQRTTYGGFEASIPSRFLRDIPDGLVQRSVARRSGRDSSYSSYREDRKERDSRWQDDTRWNRGTTLAPRAVPPAPPRPAPVVQQQYQANMRVRHPVWGEGLVIESRLLDGEETLDVIFESVGFKRLLASLAKLEIIQK